MGSVEVSQVVVARLKGNKEGITSMERWWQIAAVNISASGSDPAGVGAASRDSQTVLMLAAKLTYVYR